jgi:hypothetical protein
MRILSAQGVGLQLSGNGVKKQNWGIGNNFQKPGLFFLSWLLVFFVLCLIFVTEHLQEVALQE